jgi:hypothetical protein
MTMAAVICRPVVVVVVVVVSDEEAPQMGIVRWPCWTGVGV